MLKKILFGILVIILIPVYLVLIIASKVYQMIGNSFLTPLIEGIGNITVEMIKFWKNVFKIENDNDSQE